MQFIHNRSLTNVLTSIINVSFMTGSNFGLFIFILSIIDLMPLFMPDVPKVCIVMPQGIAAHSQGRHGMSLVLPTTCSSRSCHLGSHEISWDLGVLSCEISQDWGTATLDLLRLQDSRWWHLTEPGRRGCGAPYPGRFGKHWFIPSSLQLDPLKQRISLLQISRQHFAIVSCDIKQHRRQNEGSRRKNYWGREIISYGSFSQIVGWGQL